MTKPRWRRCCTLGIILLWPLSASAGEVKLRAKNHDPYGIPRPARGWQNVPLRTSFYLELAAQEGDKSEAVLPESVSIQLQPENGREFDVLQTGRRFATGFPGKLLPGKGSAGGTSLLVYVDPEQPLRPSTRYTIKVRAKSKSGGELPEKNGTWQFITEAAPVVRPVAFDLSLAGTPVRWHGGFFTGFCVPSFCNTAAHRIPTSDLMAQVRRNSPKSWSLQRDFWLTGMEHQPGFLESSLPNIVREIETRRITAIEKAENAAVLRVEDFFGHEQYGIRSGRPLSGDYRAGDEVLIADGVSDARAKVLAVDDVQRTVRITPIATPAGGWKLAYASSLPKKENPNMPGLFPRGGCYLRKFSPCGTPAYYWGRLDKEWDLSHKRYGRRLVVNFTDAPGDLSIDGRNWTTAKDYAELHAVVHAISTHVIDRYGDDCLDFYWSVFNEPDLGKFFWRSDWKELQKFYDYTVDAILRAFEDKGYDSNRVRVGGLELGGIFGVNLRLREFLIHCSPKDVGRPSQADKPARPGKADLQDLVLLNAAFADQRLNGRRSRRVETLCRAHHGRGSPCDFISIHAYNRASLMADKLAKAKEMALEIDAAYYQRLWVNSHEACPDWQIPADPAFSDSYLGNGYFPTWCADVARRQLQRAAGDSRYAFGETILTFWPWPNRNFGGGNDCVREIAVDDNGDGVSDRPVTVAMPILHFLGLLAAMGEEYHVLPEQTVGGHAVSGFATQKDGKIHVLVYSHNPLDTESRSEASFEAMVNLAGVKGKAYAGEEYRFDKDHNSYFRLGRSLRDRQSSPSPGTDLLGPLKRMLGAYPNAEVQKIVEQSKLRPTAAANHRVGPDGRLTLKIPLAGNGANLVVLTPH